MSADREPGFYFAAGKDTMSATCDHRDDEAVQHADCHGCVKAARRDNYGGICIFLTATP